MIQKRRRDLQEGMIIGNLLRILKIGGAYNKETRKYQVIHMICGENGKLYESDHAELYSTTELIGYRILFDQATDTVPVII